MPSPTFSRSLARYALTLVRRRARLRAYASARRLGISPLGAMAYARASGTGPRFTLRTC